MYLRLHIVINMIIENYHSEAKLKKLFNKVSSQSKAEGPSHYFF
jgi:hypothetical protein